MSETLAIEPLTKDDFDAIRRTHDVYWDHKRSFVLHHAMFVYEFGDTAYVIRSGGVVAAYLLGFIAQTGPVAYVHMVAVHPEFRAQGLARRLYDHFTREAQARGCTELKATASPANALSIEFHLGLGMHMHGDVLSPDAHACDGEVRAVRDYGGPGVDRVVFTKDI